MKLSQTTEKNKEKEINSDKELIELKKTIFEEAVNVRLDYEQNPNEDTGSLQQLVVIHKNSDFLKEE